MTIDPVLQSELLSLMGQLSAHDQARVVDFARTLAESQKVKKVGDQPKVLDP